MEYLHPNHRHESALLTAAASRYSPQLLLRRVDALAASEACPLKAADGASHEDAQSTPAPSVCTLSRTDVPAVWSIFTLSVRTLLMHQRALASPNGSCRGWRTSLQWRLLRELHEDARETGRRAFAARASGGGAAIGRVVPTSNSHKVLATSGLDA